MLTHAPRFDELAAARIAREHFGIDGLARALPSERDQNFMIESATGERIVLKIANALEEPAMLAAQQAALVYLAPRLGIVPRLVRTRTGETMVEVPCDDRRHLVWAITWIDGGPMASRAWHSRALLEDLGRHVGRLRHALAGFDHPAIHRDFYWDVANAPRVVAERRELVRDAALRDAIDRVVAAFERHTAPLLASLPRAAVHGDLNDHNVLVGGGWGADGRDQTVVGFVDYGDMVHGLAVADLAIAIAYVVIGASDPLAAAAAVVRGHHHEHPLTTDELSALFGLVLMRLAASACIAAAQLGEVPDNEYLGVSQRAIRASLPRLAAMPWGLVEATFRHACGLAPLASTARITAWLRARAGDMAPVLGPDPRLDPRGDACLVLDLGITSPLLGPEGSDNAEPPLTARIDEAMRNAGASVAIGRYDEARLLYATPAFGGGAPLEGRTEQSGEPRTVHLGLDLFASAGTPVHAPLEGVVHALADNRAAQDYGPVIILRHATDDGTPFFTLYGHLSRESLDGVRVGRRIGAGERFASLGAADVNGGWTPHLHLQLTGDLLGLGTDFPGVCRASQRDVWRGLCPDPSLLALASPERASVATPEKAETLAARRALIGGNLSLAYRDPLRIMRGWKQYLFDDAGRRYVDAYNNVPHVGHCHPRVVDAGVRQMRILNTNTRYLSDALVEYAHRLTDTLPAPLRVCYVLNSASEANELALRLARARTNARDMIVLEAAYHGNTTSLIDVSPYKHAGPGGRGAPEWVHVAPLPDDYRGPYRRDDPDAGVKYASRVGALIASLGARPLAGFLAETCPSVGGQIVLPPRYLAEAYRHVRAAGGVCIADEVQTGLGRMGTHFWAFEAHGVVPDIVVMGKPLGNGHPVAAVVTTREIADAFDNGMEFFSTFGGNNVSCAIGLAVLDVLRDEELQAHALHVGDHLLDGLRALASRHAIIGDVRGSGLFLGVELVRDRATLEPAGDEASFVANRMRERGVLLGTDGPYHNVVKIRPPMPFAIENADVLLDALDRSLALL